MGHAQELQVSEHALKRVVELVRDAGDELAERGELLGLRQALLHLLAFGLQLRLRRQVAGDEHVACPLPTMIAERGDGDHERALENGIEDLVRHGRVRVRWTPQRLETRARL